MPLSTNNIDDRPIKLETEITSQQINASPAYSITCDESMDLNDTEQTALLCKDVNYDVQRMYGERTFVRLFKSQRNKHQPHGVNSCRWGTHYKGTQKGFVTLLQKSLAQKLPTFHCILHQEALCVQTSRPECGGDEPHHPECE